MQRDRSAEAERTTTIVFETGSESVPLALIMAAIGQNTGSRINVQGTMPLVWNNGHWTAQFRGRVMNVPLSSIGREWIAYGIRGNATIDVPRADFDQSGITRNRPGRTARRRPRHPHNAADITNSPQVFETGPAFHESSSESEFSAAKFQAQFWITPEGRLYLQGLPDAANLKVAAEDENGIVLLCDVRGYRLDWFVRVLMPKGRPEEAEKAAANLQAILPRTQPRLK